MLHTHFISADGRGEQLQGRFLRLLFVIVSVGWLATLSILAVVVGRMPVPTSQRGSTAEPALPLSLSADFEPFAYGETNLISAMANTEQRQMNLIKFLGKSEIWPEISKVSVAEATASSEDGEYTASKAFDGFDCDDDYKMSDGQNCLSWATGEAGAGQWIKATFNESCNLVSFRYDERRSSCCAIDTDIVLHFDDGSTQEFHLLAKGGFQEFQLHPVQTQSVKIVHKSFAQEAYLGAKEIEFFQLKAVKWPAVLASMRHGAA